MTDVPEVTTLLSFLLSLLPQACCINELVPEEHLYVWLLFSVRGSQTDAIHSTRLPVGSWLTTGFSVAMICK